MQNTENCNLTANSKQCNATLSKITSQISLNVTAHNLSFHCTIWLLNYTFCVQLHVRITPAELIWLHSSRRNPTFLRKDIVLFGSPITPWMLFVTWGWKHDNVQAHSTSVSKLLLSTSSDSLTANSKTLLVLASVHSRLDYCNSVLYSLPWSLLQLLQSVLNSAARLWFEVWSVLITYHLSWLICIGFLTRMSNIKYFGPELSTGHFSWIWPDPAKRWPDPTRDCQKSWNVTGWHSNIEMLLYNLKL